MSDPYISVVFPAYNEARRLPATLEKTAAHLAHAGISYEIIVVDDGSRDDTVARARDVLENIGTNFEIIKLPSNRGKGFAVKSGLEAASGEFVFFSDSDLSTPIGELDNMLKLLEDGSDVVIGSRVLRESEIEVRQPFFRDCAGRVFNLVTRALLLPGIMDTQCGFKGFRRDVIPEITKRQLLDGFAFDVEILWIARRLGFSITETPVRWRNVLPSKVNPFIDGIRMLADVLRIRIIHGKTAF